MPQAKFIYIYICIHRTICIYKYMCIYIYIYAYICVYMIFVFVAVGGACGNDPKMSRKHTLLD